MEGSLFGDFEKSKSNFQVIFDGIEKELQELENLEQAELKRQKFIEKNLSSVGSYLTFNLGGKLFKTSKSTLMKFPSSLLFGIIASGIFVPEDNGTYL
jgi:hypothetical protein